MSMYLVIVLGLNGHAQFQFRLQADATMVFNNAINFLPGAVSAFIYEDGILLNSWRLN